MKRTIAVSLSIAAVFAGCSKGPEPKHENKSQAVKTVYCEEGKLDKSQQHCLLLKPLKGVVHKSKNGYSVIHDERGRKFVIKGTYKVGSTVTIKLYEKPKVAYKTPKEK